MGERGEATPPSFFQHLHLLCTFTIINNESRSLADKISCVSFLWNFITKSTNPERFSMDVQTSSATSAVAQSMGTASKAMAAVGAANNPQEIQKIMMQFQKENAKMDMTGEMMEDALDSAFDNGEEEDEADEVMNQVEICFAAMFLAVAISLHCHADAWGPFSCVFLRLVKFSNQGSDQQLNFRQTVRFSLLRVRVGRKQVFSQRSSERSVWRMLLSFEKKKEISWQKVQQAMSLPCSRR